MARVLAVLAAAIVVAMPAGVLGIAPEAGLPPEDAAPRAALAGAAALRGAPSAVDLDPREVAALRALDLRDAVEAYYAVAVGRPLSPAEADGVLAQLAPLSPGWQAGLAELLGAMAAAKALRERAFAGLSPGELRLVHDAGLRAVLEPGTLDPAEAALAQALIARIGTADLLHGAALILRAAEDARVLFRAAPPPLQRIDTSFGAITVGSLDSDTYAEDKQLLVDPGGDDLYLNNAGGVLNRQVFDATGGCVLGGGTTGMARPNLGCTPLPGQVCTYDTLNNLLGTGLFPPVGVPNHEAPGSGNGHDGSCGSDARRQALAAHAADLPNDADSRGVALLLDLDGSDTYTVPWDHHDPLFGLVDFCYPGEQDRVNTNRDLFQGGNLAGISLLWDDGAGDDVYRGRLNAQGSGHVGGVAVHVASGTGDATFWADRLSQGNGIAGAVGVLVATKQGATTYLLDPPLVYRNEFRPNGRDCVQQGRAGQGQGGFLGVGVLWTQHGGTATYRAVVHETFTTHPFDPVPGPGGAPLLHGGSDAQGSGESFPLPDAPGGLVLGAGLLVDATDGDASVCPALAGGQPQAGMLTGSTTATGTSLATMGRVAPCGKFNLAPELDPHANLGSALQHLLGGAVGARVVVP